MSWKKVCCLCCFFSLQDLFRGLTEDELGADRKSFFCSFLFAAQDRADALRREHATRRKALEDSRERGQTQEMYLEENIINLTKNKESLFHVLKEYSSKRTELIATLFTIFPITEVRLLLLFRHLAATGEFS